MAGTDSQSMLDRLFIPEAQRPNNQSWFATLDVLAPEWNLLVVIQNSLEVLLSGVHITYVKGHQDDNRTPYHLLPLQALLNVEADKWAGKYQRQGWLSNLPVWCHPLQLIRSLHNKERSPQNTTAMKCDNAAPDLLSKSSSSQRISGAIGFLKT